MKKPTFSLLLCFLFITASAQISLNEDFEDGMGGWTSNQFFSIPIEPCSGSRSVRANLFSGDQAGQMESPQISGASNGNALTINFDYKIVDWGFADEPTPPGWGSMAVEYSTDNGANWTTIETIDDSNHTATNVCQQMEYVIQGSQLPQNSDFKLRFDAVWASGDYYIYIDNIIFAQAASSQAPANDDISNASVLEVGSNYNEFSVDGSVLGATNDAVSAGCGADGPGIWYKVIVPADGSITIETDTDNSTETPGFDSVIEVFSGTPGNLTSLDCNDNSANTEPNYSQLIVANRTPGEELYVRVWENGGNEVEPFSISAYNDTLSTNTFQENNFDLFPNPTTDFITISSNFQISRIVIYNIIGQEVLKFSPTNNKSSINLSALKSGAYLLKFETKNGMNTARIIKQ